jgi:PAS domain S-box-containing protein
MFRSLGPTARPPLEAADPQSADLKGADLKGADLKGAERRLAVQHAVTAVLAESPTLVAATPRILQTICESLGWRWGALWYVDDAAGVLRCAETWHAEELRLRAFEEASRGRTFAPGVGLPGRVWSSGEPAWIADVVVDPNFPRAAVAAQEELHGAFGFPIVLGGRVLGVLEFFSSEVRKPEEDLLATLATLGSQIGQFMERRRAEERLAHSERELGDFFENAAIALHWVGADGTILRVNQAELDLLGYEREEYVGHHIADFHVDRSIIDDILCRLQANDTIRDHEARLRCKDGSIRHVLINSNVLWDGGRFVHTRCCTRDITAKKQADEERTRLLVSAQAARAEAEAANRAKDEFLATVSHELRAPLTPILLWTRLLRAGSLDAAAARRAIEAIDVNAKAQAQVVEDLLDVSRIIAGRLRLDVRPVPLPPIVDAAVESMRAAADAKGVTIERVPHATLDEVDGDAGRLQQIVWNLLSNAIKFAPRDGRVVVELAPVAGAIELTVRGTGKGISADFLPFVFERFRQADATPTRQFGGLGLGLAIVRHLVELHAGTVRAESAGEGQGASFIVRLPVRSAAPADAASARPPAAHPAAAAEGSAASADSSAPSAAAPDSDPLLARARVLVIDDEPDTRHALATLLSLSVAEVRTAGSAAEAFETLDAWRPDVVVSDVGLPGEDGYAFIRSLRARPAEHGGEVPAIALTGYGQTEDRARAAAAGFQMHLVKPIDPPELLAAIARVVGEGGSTADATPAVGAGAPVGELPTPLADPAHADLRQTVSFISHELRQPLAAMRIWLNLLEAQLGDALDEQSRAHLQQLRASIGWMTELITVQLLPPHDRDDPQR